VQLAVFADLVLTTATFQNIQGSRLNFASGTGSSNLSLKAHVYVLAGVDAIHRKYSEPIFDP
jgi:hypothetical protein